MRVRSLALSIAALVAAGLALGVGALGDAPASAQVTPDPFQITPQFDPLQVTPEPLQASCGNNRCEPPEDCRSCERDCGSCCGNNRCEAPEDCRSCERDCGSCCGNNRCEPPEDANSCPRDCTR